MKVRGAYSLEVKKEILSNLSQDSCCKLSFLSAVLKSSEYNISNNGFSIEISTKIKQLLDEVSEIIHSMYGYNAILIKDEDAFNMNERYKLIIEGDIVKPLLIDCGIAKVNEENCFEFVDGIDSELILDECCKKSYIKGLLLACGSVSGIGEKSNRSIDYHLEWVMSSEQTAFDLLELLADFNIFGRKILRKNLFVVYLQKFEQISDLLVVVDAPNAMLSLNEEFAMRTIKNTVNRINNCESANQTKTIDASITQLRAINTIMDTIGIEALGEDLERVCMLRLANEDESLEGLARLSGMTRSALNYRLNKIIKIAEEVSLRD